MLSYQHVYHAGNHADCHKHGILTLLLARLKEKPTPFCVRDIHSGRGMYDLSCAEAQKIQEYHTGIEKLWRMTDWPQELADLKQIIKTLNPDDKLRYYPGSPFISASLLRHQDRAEFFELHPQEYTHLEHAMRSFNSIAIHDHDGWHQLVYAGAPPENRGLVLIDPSYELKEDYTLMALRLQKAFQKWRTALYVVWYPLLPSNRHKEMLALIQHSGLKKCLVSEMIFHPHSSGYGMYGSGMLILNPPWQFEHQSQPTLTWLKDHIGIDQKTYWLVEE